LIGLPLDPVRASFHLHTRHAPTPGPAQVREPLHARASKRWRAYHTQVCAVVPVAAAAMARDGYGA
jgi:hypothetical protein